MLKEFSDKTVRLFVFIHGGVFLLSIYGCVFLLCSPIGSGSPYTLFGGLRAKTGWGEVKYIFK